MIFQLAAIVGVSAMIIGAVCDVLSDDERDKQSRMREDYEDYKSCRDQEYEEIYTANKEASESLFKQRQAESSRMKREAKERERRIRTEYYETTCRRVDEQYKNKQGLIIEVRDTITKIQRVRKDQVTMLRGRALDMLLQSLRETEEKLRAYLIYLEKYKKNMNRVLQRGSIFPEPFEMLLPSEFPYKGKVLVMKKKEVQERGTLSTRDGISNKYYCRDIGELDVYDDDAQVHLFVEYFEGNPHYHHVLSCSKGFFKNTALYQPKIGVEAEVMRQERDRIILQYSNMELLIYKRNLENPRCTPPRGTTLRVFPLKWDYNLRYKPEVTEKLNESFALCHFHSIPMLFEEHQFDEFAATLQELNLLESSEEWKIAPLYEEGIPELTSVKLQLGYELIIKGDIIDDGQGKSYIKYSGILSSEHSVRPEDIFVAVDTQVKVLWEEDIHLVDLEDHESMSDLVLFLFNEFKTQKALKNSREGMAYFNKWAEVTDKLINYLHKQGNTLTCEIEQIELVGKDRITKLEIHRAEVKNAEKVRKKLEENLKSTLGHTDYFIETDYDIRYPVEFNKATGEYLKIIGKFPYQFLKDNNYKLTIYQRKNPYPDVQQKNALNVFREGRLVNSKLKTYYINTSNVESETTDFAVEEFYSSNIAANPYQKNAVESALRENNFFMIQGPPGTGKTTVIIEIILQYIRKYPLNRVLVVSQANVAVDNVLKGLQKVDGVPFGPGHIIRCGKEGSIDAQILPVSFERRKEEYFRKIESVPVTEENRTELSRWKQIIYGREGDSFLGELILRGNRIIGATCVGLAQKRIGLNQLEFDLAIVDEAGRALPGELLIPVNRSRKVVLIGDHKQLPPVINPVLFDQEKLEISDPRYCREELFSKSFFEQLYVNCPESNKSMLRTQYRMPTGVGALVSKLFYEGKLESGSATSNKHPVYGGRNINCLDMSWVKGYREQGGRGESKRNPIEAGIVVEIVKDICRGCSDRIAVITPYKGQKKEIIKRFKSKGIDTRTIEVSVDTVDAFQGDEAEIVIFCTTRSRKPTPFFADEARINVALSRTKRELLIIGSLNYFDKYGPGTPLYEIAQYVRDNGKIYNSLEELIQPAGETPGTAGGVKT
mgnify:CR=1 FL=1